MNNNEQIIDHNMTHTIQIIWQTFLTNYASNPTPEIVWFIDYPYLILFI